MRTVQAIYDKGVFRPIEPVSLPEGTHVDVLTPTDAEDETPIAPMREGLARVYSILGERYESGRHDTAERHNEHQP